VFFFKNNRLCALHDPTNHVPFPPPEFYISTLPTSVTLRPGEEKDIQVRLNSTAYSPSNATFSINQTEGLKATFTPNRTSVPANGMVVSTLHINASENIEYRPYTLPIYATISFPTKVGIKGQDKIFNNTLSETINENSYLTLTVLRPLTTEEHLDIFYKSWVSPITGIWTFMAGIGAVIAPLIISIYRKRQSKKDKIKTR
jgi:archaellum component FlaF (FlaF/FlaG flagellin family)